MAKPKTHVETQETSLFEKHIEVLSSQIKALGDKDAKKVVKLKQELEVTQRQQKALEVANEEKIKKSAEVDALHDQLREMKKDKSEQSEIDKLVLKIDDASAALSHAYYEVEAIVKQTPGKAPAKGFFARVAEVFSGLPLLGKILTVAMLGLPVLLAGVGETRDVVEEVLNRVEDVATEELETQTAKDASEPELEKSAVASERQGVEAVVEAENVSQAADGKAPSVTISPEREKALLEQEVVRARLDAQTAAANVDEYAKIFPMLQQHANQLRQENQVLKSKLAEVQQKEQAGVEGKEGQSEAPEAKAVSVGATHADSAGQGIQLGDDAASVHEREASQSQAGSDKVSPVVESAEAHAAVEPTQRVAAS